MARLAVVAPDTLVAAPPSTSRVVASPADAPTAQIVTVAGVLDVARVAELAGELRRAGGRAEFVVIDLRRLEFIDSSGVNLLLAAHRRVRGFGGRMLVVNGPAKIEWFFALIGVDRELEFVDWQPTGDPARSDGTIA